MVQFFSNSAAHGIRLAPSGIPEGLTYMLVYPRFYAFVHICCTGSNFKPACIRSPSDVRAYIECSSAFVIAEHVFFLTFTNCEQYFFAYVPQLKVKHKWYRNEKPSAFQRPRLCSLLPPDGGRALMYNSRLAGVDIPQLHKAVS